MERVTRKAPMTSLRILRNFNFIAWPEDNAGAPPEAGWIFLHATPMSACQAMNDRIVPRRYQTPVVIEYPHLGC